MCAHGPAGCEAFVFLDTPDEDGQTCLTGSTELTGGNIGATLHAALTQPSSQMEGAADA